MIYFFISAAKLLRFQKACKKNSSANGSVLHGTVFNLTLCILNIMDSVVSNAEHFLQLRHKIVF